MVKHKGQFKAGNCANPNGRPKGTGTRQQLFRELIAPRKDILINKALELAENGNEAMLRLFLDRMLPPKYQENALTIQGSTTKETTSNLLDHIETGDLTADEASKIASIVQKDAEIENQTVMIEKLKALESKMDDTSKQDIVVDTEGNSNG